MRSTSHPYEASKGISHFSWVSLTLTFMFCLAVVGFWRPSPCRAGSLNAPPPPAPSQELQRVLDRIVDRHLNKAGKGPLPNQVHVAVIDLGNPQKPAMAHYNGLKRVYPSSVIKIIYMGCVYHLAGQGELDITPEVRRKLYQMIHPSSNVATAWIVDLWSCSECTEEMDPKHYKTFAYKRNTCNRWLDSLGFKGISACQKTWASPIPPCEKQFLRGGRSSGYYTNRNYMTAVATSRYLQLIAQDALVDKESCEAMRRLMIRDVRKQPYLKRRIAGGAPPGAVVYSKTGTTVHTFHDAGFIVLENGRTFVVTVFIIAKCYRGFFIRDVTADLCAHFQEKKNHF